MYDKSFLRHISAEERKKKKKKEKERDSLGV